MKKLTLMLLALACVLCCAFSLAACDDAVAVTEVTLNKTELTLTVGGEETLTATVKPDDATNKTVTWTSSASSVASVDSTGKVTAAAAGTATITATADGKKAECSVTVNAAGAAMTEQEWQAGLTAFAAAKNFDLTLSVNDSVVGYVKLDGDKYYDNGGAERILVKDGSNYYRYDKYGAKAEWTKKNSNAAEYASIVNENALNLVAAGVTAFGANYSAFEYSNGKYTAATLNVAEGFVLNDIEVTVEDGAVKKIVCTQAGDSYDTLVTIDNIGSTTIPLPDVGGSGPVEIVSGSQVNDKQWQNLITDMGVIGVDSNVTVQTSMVDIDYYTYEIANGRSKFSVAGNDSNTMFVEWDKDSYNEKTGTYQCKKYRLNNGKWEYQVTELPLDIDWDLQLFFLKYLEIYAFMYDEKEEVYVCEKSVEIELREGLNCEVTNIEVGFKNSRVDHIKADFTQIKGKDRYELGTMVFVFTNYGETEVALPGGATESVQGGNDDKKDPAKVTAEQWTKILENASNYTFTQTLPSMSTVNKVVGNKWQQTDGTGEVNQIVVKEDDTYYVYVQDTNTEAWIRTTVTVEDASQNPMAQSLDFAQNVLKVCKDDYGLFTYSDGKYTAAEIDKTATIGSKLQNLVAIFQQGQLVSVTFVFDEDIEYEFNNFGTTTVPLPVDYTESTGGVTDKPSGLAGKTYVFDRFESKDLDPELIEQVAASWKSCYIAFGEEYSVTVHGGFVCGDNAIYQQSGDEIRIYTYPDESPNFYRSFTYKNDELVLEVSVEGNSGSYVYVLQTEE